MTDLHPWRFGALALALGIAETLTALFTPEFHYHYVEGELGIIENLQALILLGNVLLAGWMLTRPATAREPLLRPFLCLAAVTMAWVLGEEISWGQHFFQWTAEGWFELHNDQNETNLHNTSSWLDQKPRALILTGILLGGIIHPLLVHYRNKGIKLFTQPWWLAPTFACLPVGVLAFGMQAIKPLDNSGLLPFELQIFRVSELQEVYIYAFMGLYLLSLHKRLSTR